jgi:tetrathionate reductase subunit B
MAKALLIDSNLCVGCHACQIACKDEFVENDWPPYSASQPDRGQFWMKVNQFERGTYPRVKLAYTMRPCMHCDNAPCIKAATGDAVYKRSDGIVIIDPVKAVGQKQIVDSCPYGVIYWNDSLNIPQKCTLCAHLLDRGWKEPRCVDACPSDAIIYGEYEDLKPTIDARGAQPLAPELGTQPRVYYVGEPKTMIAGALVDSKGECLSGATVAAKDTSTGNVAVSTTSDWSGNFWLDGLDATKTYEVDISAAGKTKTISVPGPLQTNTDLGDIQL